MTRRVIVKNCRYLISVSLYRSVFIITLAIKKIKSKYFMKTNLQKSWIIFGKYS